MRTVVRRAPAPDIVRDSSRETDWSSEMLAAATLGRRERRLRELIADVSRGAASERTASERIRAMTRLIDGLSRASVTDFLTGLRNRQGFVRDGSLLLSKPAAQARFAIAFFFDVDRLKQVNDAAGHAAGDDLLRNAARALVETFRTTDIIGRLGGDEFAVLTLTRHDDAARSVLERLTDTLDRINVARGAWPVELSVGVAIADPGSSPSLGQLLDRADRVMYQDKRARSRAQLRLLQCKCAAESASRARPACDRA